MSESQKPSQAKIQPKSRRNRAEIQPKASEPAPSQESESPRARSGAERDRIDGEHPPGRPPPVAPPGGSPPPCSGPILLEDYHLVEKLAQFDRERIPERVVHARGASALGYFEVRPPPPPSPPSVAPFSRVFYTGRWVFCCVLTSAVPARCAAR